MPRPRSLRRDLGLSLADAGAYGTMVGVGETYLPAFALVVGVAPVAAGLVATVPLLAGGILQLAAPRAIARVGNYRRWVVACVATQGLAFVPLVVIALTRVAAAPLVFTSAALYWAAGMAASAGWNGWMAKLVPPSVRSRFFGRRQGTSQTAMLVALLGAGAALQLAGPDHRLRVFAGLFGLAAAARLLSALLLHFHGLGIDPAPRRPAQRSRLRSVAPRLRGTTRGTLVIYLVVAFAATSLGGPFLTPYLFTQRHLGYAEYTAFVATVVITKIIALWRMGDVVERFGPRRVLTVSAVGITPLPLLWPLSGHLAYLLAIQVFAGVVWAAFELAMFMTLFSVDDENERTTLQVWFSGLQALSQAAASVLGGVLLGALGSDREAYFAVFLASALARFAAMTLLVRRLPSIPVLLPMVATRAWTMALRPWGGTILRPLVLGAGRLRRVRPGDRRREETDDPDDGEE